MRRAIKVVGCPSALATSIWLRRTVKPWDDRRPASIVVRSCWVSGRTKRGACMLFLHNSSCSLRRIFFPLCVVLDSLIDQYSQQGYPAKVDGEQRHPQREQKALRK